MNMTNRELWTNTIWLAIRLTFHFSTLPASRNLQFVTSISRRKFCTLASRLQSCTFMQIYTFGIWNAGNPNAWLPPRRLPARDLLWSTNTMIIQTFSLRCTTLWQHGWPAIYLLGWLVHVCGTTCPKISTIPVFQLALLANISKHYCFLLREAAVHL